MGEINIIAEEVFFMNKTGLQLDFLLGAVSPMGFYGYFEQFTGNSGGMHTVLIKAGPGCGKSTLMKKIAGRLIEKGCDAELIHCSSDPESLDGVICREMNFCILDATAPHTLEPMYPIVCEEVLSLYHLIDREKIQKNKDEAVTLFKRCSSLQERSARYITAAGSLIADSARVAHCATDFEKAQDFAKQLCRKYIPKADGTGTESVRLLSAVILNGHIFYSDTVSKLCPEKLVILHDEYGAASAHILKYIRNNALEKGHDIITCYCPMSPNEKIEHIIIPALKTGFITDNFYHSMPASKTRVIHCTRFMNKELLTMRRQRLRFNRKAADELFSQANMLQREAKENHDMLENHYKAAIDFSAVSSLCEQLLQRLGI